LKNGLVSNFKEGVVCDVIRIIILKEKSKENQRRIKGNQKKLKNDYNND